MMDQLLAKSVPSDGGARDASSLIGHSRAVLSAARTVLASTGDQQLAAVGLSAEEWRERLLATVSAAAALHDVGKANDHFQTVLRSGGLQGLRHEWVSVWLLHKPDWRSAIEARLVNPEDFDILWWSVSGHHPAIDRPIPPEPVDGAGSDLTVLSGHPDFLSFLAWLRSELRFGLIASPGDERLSLLRDGPIFRVLRLAYRESIRKWEALDPMTKRFSAVCKASLLACDVAGSAAPRAGWSEESTRLWIEKAFRNVPHPHELSEIVAARLAGNALRPFQDEVSRSTTRVTFVRAGCGSGKTIAAYQWAARRCPGCRLYLCYPTTGTATEGYRDYLHDAEAGRVRCGARLFHGRAEVDLEGILSTGNGDWDREFERLLALDSWSTPVAACTVDTVLGVVQNHRRGLLSWPALASGAFVFDEIHSYDDRLFGALLRFLRDVRGVSVLLMTASLPPDRLRAVRSSLEAINETMREIAGPTELEGLPRYHRLDARDPGDALADVKGAAEQGDNVLWITNTVNGAIAAADAAERTGLSPLVYHSRFRYEDRVRRHREVVDSFHHRRGVVAICTQVAEVSLDLSADLLVTDLAPAPALIQRLGRLNRRARPHRDGSGPPTKPFIIVEPKTAWPYEGTVRVKDAFSASRNWLQRLGYGSLSQSDLAAAFEELDAGGQALLATSAWLDGGPETAIRELRTASPGITIVLSADAKAVRARETSLVRVALPMPPPPRDVDWKSWPRIQGCPVAPEDTVEYEVERGAAWRRK